MFNFMNLLTAGAAAGSIALAALFGGDASVSVSSPCACCTVCACDDCKCTELGCSCDVGGDCLCDAACCENDNCCTPASVCETGCCAAK